ncbi:uncharacterized protein HD556DRAFT_1303924 [Suillus plorans]|uniref:Uncharacterized protein n=1 Tax=Suillus plorans TaxID=116603 RepID=A0A9P7J4P7_9AGAM|nr:uncharacterized protein HD556DRAFT_1315080 [Suillus plorans]XP_041153097.1 uncharacterized protein HD556DRAFT_1314160 [Suillus plorans]XP_041163357.1 uncharacterized protein HD556DRAFT_1306100 [Suillus plorans]XP_041164787.1 uncharacterized protein HD556DRAFT_1304985 [Suillus plorans]XP_041165509.1 uncharacterized protein HD556DRAFT_1303924 [Suillus plorans]KAG1784425.1 hypothetical protein HD556DRAFT_1315080 [Suillus plorans]KAG1785614.1 hypothetical protein HD556DRAFT_1314160 [Suillus pl
MTKVLIQTWNDKHKSNLILSKGLDLVEEEEQITHQTFKFDPNDLGNKEEYTSVKAEIQGKDSKEPSDHYLLVYKVELRENIMLLAVLSQAVNTTESKSVCVGSKPAKDEIVK